MKFVNATTSVVHGFCAQIRQYVQNRNMFQNGVNFLKRLKPYHYSLVSNKIIYIFIFSTSLQKILRESSIYTRVVFRDTRFTKNNFRGFGPDLTLAVRVS